MHSLSCGPPRAPTALWDESPPATHSATLNHSVARTQTLNRSLFQRVPNQIYVKPILSILCVTSYTVRLLCYEHIWKEPGQHNFDQLGNRHWSNTETTERTTQFCTLPPATTQTLLEDLYAHSAWELSLKWHKWGWCSHQYFKYCKLCVIYNESLGTATFSLLTLWLQ